MHGHKDIHQELTDDQRMLISDMVYGYSLHDKEWLQFYINGTLEIEFDSHTFESLVLSREQEGLKDLLLAIATAQSKQLDTFDVVRGKGRGMVLQLSRSPSVGKDLDSRACG